MAFKVLIVLLLCMVACAGLTGGPCDNILCTCFGPKATCIVKAEYDLTGYLADSTITGAVVTAPFSSLCNNMRKLFTNLNDFECTITASAGGVSDSLVSSSITAGTTSSTTGGTSTAAKNGWAVAKMMTEMQTEPTLGGVDMEGAGTTVFVVTTEPVTTSPIDPPKRYMYYKEKGEIKRCVVMRTTCHCDSCAKTCPCEPCIPPTPRIIWIPPRPTNPAPPTTPCPSLDPTTTPPTTPTTTPPTTPPLTTPPVTTSNIPPKCGFHEAVEMVLDDKQYFAILCERYITSTSVPASPTTLIAPVVNVDNAKSVVVEENSKLQDVVDNNEEYGKFFTLIYLTGVLYQAIFTNTTWVFGASLKHWIGDLMEYIKKRYRAHRGGNGVAGAGGGAIELRDFGFMDAFGRGGDGDMRDLVRQMLQQQQVMMQDFNMLRDDLARVSSHQANLDQSGLGDGSPMRSFGRGAARSASLGRAPRSVRTPVARLVGPVAGAAGGIREDSG